METEEIRDSVFAMPKFSERMSSSKEARRLAKSHEHKVKNTVINSKIYNSQEGKDISIEKNLDLMRQFERSPESVRYYVHRSARSEKEGKSCRIYIHGPSRRAATSVEASSSGRDDTNHDLSKPKRQRLNETNANDSSTMEHSAAGILEIALNMGVNISSEAVPTTTEDDSEQRKQRRKLQNRESAKKSRLRKQECEELLERIQSLQADGSALCKELSNLSEECATICEQNNLIKEELEQMCGPGIIYNLTTS